MKEIPLTRGKVALVDDADFEGLSRFKWYAHKGTRTWYAHRNRQLNAGKQTTVLMHRQILGAVPGKEVDHRDGNGLNNQRCNLRLCEHAENGHNRCRKMAGGSSRYKGVSWNKRLGKWRADISVNWCQKYLGLFSDEGDAARAYNAAAVQFYGEFAALNVIDENGGGAR